MQPEKIITLKDYRDIIAADLSADKQLITTTERVAYDPTPLYKYTIRAIHMKVHSKEMTSPEPVYSIFIPNQNPKIYQILKFIGTKVINELINIKDEGLVITTKRKGLNLKECLNWVYKRELNTLYCIHSFRSSSATFSIITFVELKLKHTSYAIPYAINKPLPPDLLLSPNLPAHLPLFRFSPGNMHVEKRESGFAIIAQLYTPNEPLELLVLTTDGYSRRISFQDIENQLVSFLTIETSVLAFIPNKLLAMFDFDSDKPIITKLDNAASSAPFTQIQTINDSQYIIDMESKNIFAYSVNETPFSCFNFDSQTSIDSAAFIYSVFFPNINGASLFARIQSASNPTLTAELFFRSLYDYLLRTQPNDHSHIAYKSIPKDIQETLSDYEREFPSAGKISRTRYFQRTYPSGRGISRKIMDNIIARMHRQNQCALMLRMGIDEWVSKYQVDDITFFTVGLILVQETRNANAPKIFCLDDELRQLSQTLCSSTLRMTMIRHGVFGPSTGFTEEDQREVEYWVDRLPEVLFVAQHPSLVSFFSTHGTKFLSVSQESLVNSEE